MNQIQTRYAKVTEEVDAVMAAQSIALAHLNSGPDEYNRWLLLQWRLKVRRLERTIQG